ncbi:MAG TPA: DUF885 domain-containing protein [Candidatus Onthovicinus excrementipullorum]|nr:DUF885 domain-containing protein [Candidatus Onthovicinus excrementipullorum]
MRRTIRTASFLLAGLLVLSMAGCSQVKIGYEQEKFDTFMQDVFVNTMQSDYTTAHTFLKNPADFGVDMEKVPVNLGDRFTQENMEKQREQLRETNETFREFDRDLLTAEQQDIYDTFDAQIALELQLSDAKFDYYAPLFESMSGLQFQLPTLFADWEVRSEQDVQDLITLVQDVKPYVASALDYTQKQADMGLLMLDLDAVADYCSGIVQAGEQSAILSAMSAGIDSLNLDPERAETYKNELVQAFTDSFIPAFQYICDTMDGLKASGKNHTLGLAQFEHGKEYYELLLRQSIGADQSVQEVREMMETAGRDHLKNLSAILLQNPTALLPLAENNLPETGYDSYQEILDDLRDKIPERFPAVQALNYNIVAINEEIASDTGVAAYFNIPPLDGTSAKQLRVNPNTGEVSSLSTYSTVAHEGFPGHMYQYAYMYEHVDSDYIKALSNVPAYTEGYAVYAQYEALKELEGIDQALLDAYRENELISYCAIIVCDIGIHYEGWSIEEFTSYLNKQGFSLAGEDAQLQYEQLWANPCAFEPYYVGYEQFRALKEKAQDALGDQFQEKAFNEVILKSGTVPFSVVERNVEAYIKNSGV